MSFQFLTGGRLTQVLHLPPQPQNSGDAYGWHIEFDTSDPPLPPPPHTPLNNPNFFVSLVTVRASLNLRIRIMTCGTA